MEKGKMEREVKNKSQHLGFLSQKKYTWPLSRCITNLKTLTHRSREICSENLIGEKEKWTNKGNGKQQEADSLLHITTSHTQHLFQISKS